MIEEIASISEKKGGVVFIILTMVTQTSELAQWEYLLPNYFFYVFLFNVQESWLMYSVCCLLGKHGPDQYCHLRRADD